MGVPPLFSFLGGSGSGTASEACIGLFVGIMTLAGIGEKYGGMASYMASGSFWERPIGCYSIQLTVMKNSGYEFVEVKRFVSLDE